jgi:hypothetical protein
MKEKIEKEAEKQKMSKELANTKSTLQLFLSPNPIRRPRHKVKEEEGKEGCIK